MSTLDYETISSAGLIQSFQIRTRPYTGLDFSRLAFVFCGQGQMSPGLMAEESESIPIFKAHFAELDAFAAEAGLGCPSDYVRRPGAGEQGHLAAVMALFTLQVSMYETLIFTGHRPAILTAHSFGEFSQLTASGVLGFRDMLRFLVERHRCLSTTRDKFKMVAVNDAYRMAQLSLDLPFVAANYNTHRQTTFVCFEKDVAAFRATLKEHRIASTVLEIDYPYHTPWLEPARRELRERMEGLNLNFSPPKIPFLSSVTGQVYDGREFSAAAMADLLCDQLTTPVRFPEQIRGIYDRGIAHFVELSPVDVLTPFIEQVLMQAKVNYKTDSFRRRIKTAGSRRTSSKLKDSKILDVFNRALKAMTGYTVEDIHLEDRIREDLGIDSIKKAEIVFRMVDEIATGETSASAPVNLAELATFADVIEYLENSEKARERAALNANKKTIGPFVVQASEWLLSPRVDFSVQEGPGKDDLYQVHMQSGTEVLDPVSAAKSWIGRYAQNPPSAKHWVFVHDGSDFAKALGSFLRSLALERKSYYTAIQNETGRELSERELWLESLNFFHDDIRLDAEGRRWIKSYRPLEGTAKTPGLGRKILAFGGLGGVAIHCLNALKTDPAEVLVLVGRSPRDQALEAKLELLKDLATQIEYHVLDCSNPEVILPWIEEQEARFGIFDLCLHSVGTEVSELLGRMTEGQVASVLEAKMALARELALWAVRHPGSRVVLNSSTVAEIGSTGQTVYSFANGYLNALSDSYPNVLTIQWPAWRDTGMANQQLNVASVVLSGLPVLDPTLGTQLFRRALSQGGGRVLIFPAGLADEAASYGNARADENGLLKPASKDRSLYALPGLTQKHLPYLTHHYVKNICPLPASGSMALMLYRGYLDRGEIGVLKDFSVMNFVIVNPDVSPYFLEASFPSADEVQLQIRSNQLIVQGSVVFDKSPPPQPNRHEFTSDRRIEIEFNQNVPILIGPLFKLEQGIFANSSGRLIERMDLRKTPHYTGLPILDKLHKLMEFTFSALCIKAMDVHGKMVLPKAVTEVRVYPSNLDGHLFYAVVDDFLPGEKSVTADLCVVNRHGDTVVEMKGYRSIFISRSRDESAKQLRTESHLERFF